MVDCSTCTKLYGTRRTNTGVTCLPGMLLWIASAVFGHSSAVGQASPSQDSRESSGQDRVVRLQDSLRTDEDWDIGIPVIEPDASTNAQSASFAALIRDGRALDSEIYLALDRELRQVQRALQRRPDDDRAQSRLGEIRRALVQRIEVNIEFDYLYAARVYIALLEQAGAAPEQVAIYLQQLAEINQS